MGVWVGVGVVFVGGCGCSVCGCVCVVCVCVVYVSMCVRVYVRACVHACMHACVRAFTNPGSTTPLPVNYSDDTSRPFKESVSPSGKSFDF